MTGKKKSKGITMDLGTFHENVEKEKKENWADLDDEENGPGEEQGGNREEDRRNERQERYEKRGNYYDREGGDRREGGRSYERRDDRREGGRDGERRGPSDRNRIDLPQKPVPERAPFIAYVGNLAFGVVEPELDSFFSEYCKVTNVRILSDRETGRSKGFGYVTFADRDSLVTALQANGEEIQGRKIRVDVAEDMASNSDREGFKGRKQGGPPTSRADQVDKWERGVSVIAKDTPPPNRSDRYNRSDRNDRDRNDREGSYERRGGYSGSSERKPLDLKPRSSPPESASASAASPKASKPNPFGDARPRDETAAKQRELEIAEKIKSDQQKLRESSETVPAAPKEKKAYQPPGQRERREGDRNDRNYDRKPQSKYGNKSGQKQSNGPKKLPTAQTKETKIATSNAFGDLSVDN